MLAAFFLLPVVIRMAPVTVVVNRVPHHVVAIRGIPLDGETIRAWNLETVLSEPNRLFRFWPGELWRNLVVCSFNSQERTCNPNLRLAVDLDDGRRIAFDGGGSFAVLPRGTTSVVGWHGPVRRLTEVHRAQLTRLTSVLHG